MSEKKNNKDWITLTFPIRPLQITFERELFEGDNECDFTEEHCLESAWDIIGDMGAKEMGEIVHGNFTEDYEPKVTSGYNDDVEGDIKEIMDSKTKSAEIISLGEPPKVECEEPILVEREVVWSVKSPGIFQKAIAEKKNKQIGNKLELNDGTVLVLNDNLQWEKK